MRNAVFAIRFGRRPKAQTGIEAFQVLLRRDADAMTGKLSLDAAYALLQQLLSDPGAAYRWRTQHTAKRRFAVLHAGPDTEQEGDKLALHV